MSQKQHDLPLDEHIHMLDQKAKRAIDNLLENPSAEKLNQAWGLIQPEGQTGEGRRAYEMLGEQQFGQFILEGLREQIREVAARNVSNIESEVLPVLCEPPSATVLAALIKRDELQDELTEYLRASVEEWWNRAEVAQMGHTRYQLLLAIATAVSQTGLPAQWQSVIQQRIGRQQQKQQGQQQEEIPVTEPTSWSHAEPGDFDSSRELLLLRMILKKGREATPPSASERTSR